MNTTTKTLTTAKLDFLTPDFEPIKALLEHDSLVVDLMWMQKLTLSDDTVLHAYKHAVTRRYIYVTPELQTFRASLNPLSDELLYTPVRASSAIRGAFDGGIAKDDDRIVLVSKLIAKHRELELDAPSA